MRASAGTCLALLLVGTTSFGLGAGSARAATISVEVSPQTVPGASVDVALRISGLVDAGAPSLGAFDLDVSFDPGLLDSPAVVFGDPVVGDQLDLLGLGALGPMATAASGMINLFEVSLDSIADLNALQAGEFTIATLTFVPLDSGTSPIVVSINALSDAWGDPLDVTLVSGAVTAQVVPVPAAVWLAGSSLLVLMRMARRA